MPMRLERVTPRARSAVLFATVTAFAFAMVAWRAELRVPGLEPGVDGFHYSAMAHGLPEERILAPFRSRIFTPGLVAVLPFEVTWGFAVVTAAATGAAVAIMDRLLRLWFSVRIVWFGLALLAVSPLLFNPADPFRVDTPLVAFSAAIMLALATKRWLWVVALMPLAVVNHELALVLLIPILIVAWREDRVPGAVVTAGLSIAAYWVMHRSGWIVLENDRGNILHADYREEMVRWNAQKYGTVMGAVWAHFVGSIGILGLLAPFGWRHAPQVVKDTTWILVPCTVGILTASDWGRLFLPALPVLVVLSCVTASRLAGDGNDDRLSIAVAGDATRATGG